MDHAPLWPFLISFFFIGMGTSSLYFSALTASAKNFVDHRGLSLAIPIAAFGLSSFWESQLAGSSLFSRNIETEGGNAARELDVVKLFHFFAIMLSAIGIIGGLGLMVIPAHISKRIHREEATEEDALLPRAAEDSSPSVPEEITAEHRPFLTDKSTYMFAFVLLILLGSGEMFINCVFSSSVGV